jgi:RimJ/RimL family protein N-acetyltransferase
VENLILADTQITLTSMKESDISQEYLDSLNDSDHMKYSRNVSDVHTLTSQIEYITSFKDSFNLLFGIKEAKKGKLVGSITCYVDFHTLTLDLGFLVFRKHQGFGYATRALGLLIPFLETEFPGMTLVVGSHKENLAMHKVALNLGFRNETPTLLKHDSNLRFVKKLSRLSNSSQPELPHFISSARKIGVVAYDAGGAEQVAWLLKDIKKKVLAYIGGPAIKIFEYSGVTFEKSNDLNELIDCDLVISGSGWMSSLENDAIRKCNYFKVPCITVLDHWMHYQERFVREPKVNPKMLAVTNLPALQIANVAFPNQPIWLFPDRQVEYYKSRIENSFLKSDVLVLLEPSSILSSGFTITDELERAVIRSAIRIKEKRKLETVTLRLHPSQDATNVKYLNLQAEFPDLLISATADLVGNLKLAAVVLGFNTYGLYLSAMCGIETRSYFAGATDHWTNNFKNLITPLDFE